MLPLLLIWERVSAKRRLALSPKPVARSEGKTILKSMTDKAQGRKMKSQRRLQQIERQRKERIEAEQISYDEYFVNICDDDDDEE